MESKVTDNKKTGIPKTSYEQTPTRRQHPKETREAARSMYENPTSPGYQSYPNVAKELGLNRWQTVAGWAKEDGWNKKRVQQVLSAILPPREMVEEHLAGWKEIASAALKILKKGSGTAPIYGKALEGYEKATEKQWEMTKIIARIEQEDTEKESMNQAESRNGGLFPTLPKPDKS
jgi:hypothetical protein